MASTKQDRDFTAIRVIVAAQTDALSLDEIAAALVPTIAERTLSRFGGAG